MCEQMYMQQRSLTRQLWSLNSSEFLFLFGLLPPQVDPANKHHHLKFEPPWGRLEPVDSIDIGLDSSSLLYSKAPFVKYQLTDEGRYSSLGWKYTQGEHAWNNAWTWSWLGMQDKFDLRFFKYAREVGAVVEFWATNVLTETSIACVSLAWLHAKNWEITLRKGEKKERKK